MLESRVKEILKRLRKEYKDAKIALVYKTPFELLVATILSAQTTDKLVNKTTGKLFKKYRSIKSFANSAIAELEGEVASVNFYKTKAKNIQMCSKLIIEQHGSEVPKTMAELTALPGIARKTANIILWGGYGLIEGIAVDTHVKRLSNRLELSNEEDPVKIERDLISITPKKDWPHLSNLLIYHGRAICDARRPRHDECVLNDICPSAQDEEAEDEKINS